MTDFEQIIADVSFLMELYRKTTDPVVVPVLAELNEVRSGLIERYEMQWGEANSKEIKP